MVNPIFVNPVVKDDDFFVDEKSARTIMHALFDGNLQKVDEHIKKTYKVASDDKYSQWIAKFGVDTLRRAHEIIRNTQTAVDLNQKWASHAKNFRLIDFCEGRLDGREDPHVLCELHTQAMSPTPKTFVRPEGPRTPLGPPPSRFRRRTTFEEAA